MARRHKILGEWPSLRLNDLADLSKNHRSRFVHLLPHLRVEVETAGVVGIQLVLRGWHWRHYCRAVATRAAGIRARGIDRFRRAPIRANQAPQIPLAVAGHIEPKGSLAKL